MSPSIRKVLLTAGKIALAAALLALVVGQIDWHEFASTLAGLHPLWLVGAVACLAGSMLTAALRWRALLAVQQVRLGVAEVFKLALLGEFSKNKSAA